MSKKLLLSIIAVILSTAMVSSLAGCAEKPASSAENPASSADPAGTASETDTSPATSELKPYQPPAVELKPYQLPAGFGDRNIATPDFLTDGQKQNFTVAYSALIALQTDFSAFFPDADYQNTFDETNKDGLAVQVVFTRTGVSYDSFREALTTVFTKDFVDAKLDEKFDGQAIAVGNGGELGFVNAAKGSSKQAEKVEFIKTDDTHFKAVVKYADVDTPVTFEYALSDDGLLFGEFETWE